MDSKVFTKCQVLNLRVSRSRVFGRSCHPSYMTGFFDLGRTRLFIHQFLNSFLTVAIADRILVS